MEDASYDVLAWVMTYELICQVRAEYEVTRWGTFPLTRWFWTPRGEGAKIGNLARAPAYPLKWGAFSRPLKNVPLHVGGALSQHKLKGQLTQALLWS